MLLVDCDGGEMGVLENGEFGYLAKDISDFFESLSGDEEPEDSDIEKIAYAGDEKLLRQFIAAGHSIESVTLKGRKIVEIAALCNDLPMVKACAACGASLESLPELMSKNPRRMEFLHLLRKEGVLS